MLRQGYAIIQDSVLSVWLPRPRVVDVAEGGDEMSSHYPDGHNVGLGMVPHKPKCRCLECENERLKKEVERLQAENAKLQEHVLELAASDDEWAELLRSKLASEDANMTAIHALGIIDSLLDGKVNTAQIVAARMAVEKGLGIHENRTEERRLRAIDEDNKRSACDAMVKDRLKDKILELTAENAALTKAMRTTGEVMQMRESKFRALLRAARKIRSAVAYELGHHADCDDRECYCGLTGFVMAVAALDGEVCDE